MNRALLTGMSALLISLALAGCSSNSNSQSNDSSSKDAKSEKIASSKKKAESESKAEVESITKNKENNANQSQKTILALNHQIHLILVLIFMPLLISMVCQKLLTGHSIWG